MKALDILVWSELINLSFAFNNMFCIIRGDQVEGGDFYD